MSGLILLEYMAKTGKRPSELVEDLFSKVGPHYYRRRDIAFAPEDRERLEKALESGELSEVAGMPVIASDAIDGRRFIFSSNGWLLARLSGTEPLLRIYAEADSSEKVQELLDGATMYLGL